MDVNVGLIVIFINLDTHSAGIIKKILVMCINTAPAFEPPALKNKFICIVNRKSPELAAMVSSYLTEEGTYLPLFEIQDVTGPDNNNIQIDENTFSRDRAKEVCVMIRNTIGMMGGFENVILVGLSEDQKSYLQFSDKIAPIVIDKYDEVHPALSVFFEKDKPFLSCHPDEYLNGLQVALTQGNWLSIDAAASPVASAPMRGNGGCIVIEAEHSAMSVMAINYAHAVKADIFLVEKLKVKEERDVKVAIADWKRNGDRKAKTEVHDRVNMRINTINPSTYGYITFFTAGLPYSLVIGNPVPCTYVHLCYRPDHFVFQNIFLAGKPAIGSGLVFSPQSFVREEISEVSKQLNTMNYYVRELIGDKATMYNFNGAVQHLPYDLLHICSHGGEVSGTRIEMEFIDSRGTNHTVEYEITHSFAVTPIISPKGSPMVEKHHMIFPRVIDGYNVGRPELDDENEYPPAFFVEMQEAALKGTAIRETRIGDIAEITDSKSIQCKDFPCLGMFSYSGTDAHPFIFNNTCWSWGNIAESFIYYGASGYIGTLWNIDNDLAADCAIEFYGYINSITIMEAIHEAGKLAVGGPDENIYVYFGLPFTRIKQATSQKESRGNVYGRLSLRLAAMAEKADVSNDPRVKESLKYIIRWIKDDLTENFTIADRLKRIKDFSEKFMNP